MPVDSLTSKCAQGDLEGVQYLLGNGDDPSQPNEEGLLPLATAAFWGFSDIVDILLKYGVNVDGQNMSNKWTASHCAAFQGHGKVLMKLLDCGPDLSMLDSKGRTAIDYASGQDAIWPILGAKGYKRTPKTRLLEMGVIEKSTASPSSRATSAKYQSRPGSSYVMRQLSKDSDPNTQLTKHQAPRASYDDFAAADGDILTKELPPLLERKPSFSVWQP